MRVRSKAVAKTSNGARLCAEHQPQQVETRSWVRAERLQVAHALRLGHLSRRRLRQEGAVKAIGSYAARWIAEIEKTCKGVGPNGLPVHQIGRNFHDHRLS